MSHILLGHETPKVCCTFALPVLETLYAPEQIVTGQLRLFGTVILLTRGCEIVPYILQLQPPLSDFPFINNDVVPAAYTPDSIS